MKTALSLLIISLLACCSNAQEKFTIKSRQTKSWRSIYQIVDEKGKVIRSLDTSKYIVCLSDEQLGYFAVFAIKGKTGWIAIDKNENQLFEVYNTSFGEPSPDGIVDGKIRIVDKKGKIGFANNKGKIVIKPQFEMVSEFYKGKAIIAQYCKKVPWSLPNELNHSDCQHFSIICKKHGYIDETGKVISLGDFSFEQIAKKIKWKSPSEIN